MNDKELIQRVRVLKAVGVIKNYYELAEQLGLTEKSFYNWLGGYYKLGYKNKQKLANLLKEIE